MSASAAQASSSSRSRNQARKKVNDDATYFGPTTSAAGTSGNKRQAADKAEGEPRVKRKRLETSHPLATTSKKDVVEVETRKSVVEFQRMKTSTLHKYMVHFDLVPHVYPSPLSPDDPPPPSSLADPELQSSRAPSPPTLTPANRPRRDPKDAQNRRRSSRLLEEEPRNRVPVLADVTELHGILATIVERHFREMTASNSREELDTLAAFMCAVDKSKGGKYTGI